MLVGSTLKSVRGSILAASATAALAAATVLSLPGTSYAAPTGPCDIYAAGGTPCVAAHSSIRALYASYTGPLYQVKRALDNTYLNIGVAADGYSDTIAQDNFCANTTCVVWRIFDQSPQHNDLDIEGPGEQGPQNNPVPAAALPVTAGGKTHYGLSFSGTMGYRDNTATGTARNGQPEGVYMVASGTHYNDHCCFDYGNTEITNTNTGNGHMDAVNFGNECWFDCPINGVPRVMADMENGLFAGGNGAYSANTGRTAPFVTALLKNNGQTTYAIKDADATTGSLTTRYSGSLPTQGGYLPMHQEGGIVLGTGGDNSNTSIGSFFEGVMTAGYPSDTTDNNVQANIVGVGYRAQISEFTSPPTAGTIGAPGGQCVDVSGNDNGVNGAAVQMWNCLSTIGVDQHWTHNPDDSLATLGRCLDIIGNGTANGTQVQLWDCNGNGGQKWLQQADGSLKNPQSGRCLDDPNGVTGNGTRLQIWDCTGGAAQKFSVNGGGVIHTPGAKCVDVSGDDNGGNGAAAQIWNCVIGAVDQHWVHSSDGRLHTLGRCLDITGNGTANGTQIQLWDCNTAGGQVWQQQADGSLRNPQSGRCLDSPGGATNDGTRLQIWDCNGGSPQKFGLS